MPKHQRDILSFLDWLLLTYKIVPYNELETNGTFLLNQGFGDVISQINCSPKLANSGMTPEQRIRPEVIKQIQKHSNHQWKIVISSRDDYLEFVRDFVEPFNLAHKRIVLMPACDNREDLAEATKMTFEVAKEFQVRAITRSHILAYDRVTGV
jgi:organic radical activating enzyme